jgi:RNA-directed DNA polymerase
VRLYIERWPKAPVQLEDGSLIHREKRTPQGGVISPLLANLFLHYAFDKWMPRQYPQIPFERYADDGICHCQSRSQAGGLRAAIGRRFAECRLELNSQKTRIVFCKDDKRKQDYPEQKFDFLGYTFRPRRSKSHNGSSFFLIPLGCYIPVFCRFPLQPLAKAPSAALIDHGSSESKDQQC